MSHARTPSKQEIRLRMRKKRDNLTDSRIPVHSGKLWNSLSPLLSAMQEKRESPLSVMAYMSFRGEFPTEDFCKKILDSGSELILPYTDENFIIHPCRIPDLGSLRISRLGIKEPDPMIHPEVSADVPDVIVMPGLAFDRTGNRIGFGRGCYDRFLADRKRPVLLIGAAYDFQITDGRLPSEPSDIPVQYLVTESGLSRCGK